MIGRGLVEQVRRGDALIDLHPIEPGNALTLMPCPPDRPAAQRLSGPDPDQDGPSFHLVENQAVHPGPQNGISVDRRHSDELHLLRPDEQCQSQEIIDITADVRIERTGRRMSDSAMTYLTVGVNECWKDRRPATAGWRARAVQGCPRCAVLDSERGHGASCIAQADPAHWPMHESGYPG